MNFEEERIIDSETGGEKGRKLARFDLLPWDALWEVSELFGRGAQKYAERNWERGYNWSLSFASAMRHATQWWNGEECDTETGAHHLSCFTFHALALLSFTLRQSGTDDRPVRRQT